MPAILTRQTLCYMSSSVVSMLTYAGVMQCVATVLMLAGVVLFSILMGHSGSCAPHKQQCSM